MSGLASATGQPKYQEPFEPLVPGFRFVKINDVAALRAAVNKNTCAILLEPIQGEGGFVVPAAGFLPALVKFANDNGIVFVADEVQTGFCRTGEWFACNHEGIVPDLITTAKGIAGGLPLAAVTGRAEIMDSVHPGGLGGTYGGNPLACAAAVASIKVMERAGGRQEKVAVGDVISVDRISAKPGETVSLTPVLLEVDGKLTHGKALSSVKVTAEVVDHNRGPKIEILRYKNKTGYRRRQGHRADLTDVQIVQIGDVTIAASDKVSAKAAAPKAEAKAKTAQEAAPKAPKVKKEGPAVKRAPLMPKGLSGVGASSSTRTSTCATSQDVGIR